MFNHEPDLVDRSDRVARPLDLLVSLEVQPAGQDRHNRGDPELHGATKVPAQRLKSVGLLGDRQPRLVGDHGEDMDRHRPHERRTVGEAAVERCDPNARPTGDVLQRRVRTLVNEHIASRHQQAFAVAAGIDTHSPS
jgi:hypothetical protein